MSAISLKSITGITSITTPAGVDNQLTLHNNNTSEAVKLDTAGNLHFHNHLNITGVSTAANFKTGTSNLHNTGLNIFDLDVDGHTNLDNVSVAGVSTHSDYIHLLDDKRLKLGSDQDMFVYHDNIHGYVSNRKANLYLQAPNYVEIGSTDTNGSATETSARFIRNGAAELYHNDIKRLETSSSGVTVTGQIISDGLQMGDSEYAKFGSHDDLIIYHDGSNSYIDENGTGNLRIRNINGNGIELISGNGELNLKCNYNGSVDLYHDGTKKFETTSLGVTVTGFLGINVASPDSPLEVAGTGPSLATIHHSDGGTNDEARIMLGALSSNPPDQRGAGISARNNGAGHDLEIQTSSTHSAGPSTKMTVTSAGNVQIPNDSGKLQIGASQDLLLFHDGSESYVKNANASSNLILESAHGVHIKHGGENMARFIQDGAVELYYDNSRKLYTDNDGVTIGGPGYEQLKIDGQVGDCILKSSGAEIEFTRGSSSNINCSNSAGYLNIFTGGQTTYPAMRIFASTGHTASGAKVGINTDAIGVDTVMSVMAQPGQPALYSSYGMRIMPNGANSFGYPGHYITNASGVYVIHATIPANNTWTQVAAGRYHGATVTARIGDASSKRTIFANYDFTAPNYGVAHFNEIANNGAWNTGGASMRIASAGTYDYAIEVQHNSYYNTSNNSSVHLIFNVC